MATTRLENQELPFHLNTSPAVSAATQNEADAHDTAESPSPRSIPVGFDHVRPLYLLAWLPETATQNVADEQDTSLNPLGRTRPRAGFAVDHVVPLKVTASFASPSTMQNVVLGQDTALARPRMASLGFDQRCPSKVTKAPDRSTATQNVAVGHDRSRKSPVPGLLTS
ncbi:MAG: hypothetical protein J2P57_11290 [Acidimicrobiaceae bacterium]|nr:hypothetical protein [Acidimicrobiaceae bacterium]